MAAAPPPGGGELWFGILGPLEVRAGGRLVRLGGQQRGLLGLLLLDANRVVSTDRLIYQLWDGRPPPTARDLLHGLVTRLRRALRVGPGPARQLLLHRPPGYLLDVRAGELDLARLTELERAAARCPRSAAGAAQAAGLLSEALGLWRGVALSDIDLDACRVAADRLEEYRWAVLERRIDLDLRLGRHSQLVGELQGHVRAQPMRERLWAQLLVTLHGAGQRADALAAYRRLRASLVEQLGVEPGELVRHLHRTILAGGDALAAYQQHADAPEQEAVPAEQPALDAWRVVPAQLPSPTGSFVGRGEQLDQLDTLLVEAGDHRPAAVPIVVLTGTAGVGKTALALYWGHRVRERFPDGQLFANLNGYAPTPPARPIEVVAGFLHALGVPAPQIPVDLEPAVALYRSLLAGKRMLVVLDNARDAPQVRPLLPGEPGCLVLVTSRDQFGGLVALEGASRLALDVLSTDAAGTLLTHLLGAGRVAAEPAAAAELARVCAYLPLALRVAAANLAGGPRWTIAGFLAELTTGDRLTSLRVDGDEQTAVRTAFDRSYATLTGEARRLFRLLGLVPGPDLTVEATAALAGIPAGQAKSMLTRLAGGHLLEQHAPGRYTFHDLLRLYAAERARQDEPPPERAAAVQRWLAWYLRTADLAARRLYPEMSRLPQAPTDHGAALPATALDNHTEALSWLDAERRNLIAAVQHAATHGPRPVAWQLADSLRGYYWLRMHTVDWLAVARAALAAAEAEADLPGQAAAQLSLANLHDRQTRYPPAIEHYSRALALSRKTGWRECQSAALNNLASVHARLGHLGKAARRYAQALAIDQQTDRPRQAITLGNLGLLLQDMGRLDEAKSHHARSLELHREVGSPVGEAIAVVNLGLTCHLLGLLDQALDHLTHAFSLLDQIGDQGMQGDALCILAEIHRDAGRYPQARELATDALARAREAGNRRAEADASNALGTVHCRLAHHRQAIDQHEHALRLARDLDLRHQEIQSRLGLAAAHQQLDASSEALEWARPALHAARQAGLRVLEGQALATLAGIHLGAGEPDRAVSHAEQALALHRETGHRLGEAHALLLLGHAQRLGGDRPRATGSWRRALRLFTAIGAPEAAQVSLLLGGDAAG